MSQPHSILPQGLPGQVLPCLVIDDHRVMINPSLNQMESFVVNPRHTEVPDLVKSDNRVRDAFQMRQRTQRMIASSKAKRDNIPGYAKYLEDGMIKNLDYVTPAQSLVFTTQLTVYVASAEATAATYVHIPPGALGAHDDGETQYLARLQVRNQYPETGDTPFAVVVDHGRSVDWGGQAFHDLNLLGVPMSAAVAILADTRDPATKIAKQMARGIPELASRVSFDTRQVSTRSEAVLTITTLRRATVASLVGRKVFALGNRPLGEEVSETEERELQAVWRRIFSALRPFLTHDTVVGLPVVLTAIGIAAHETRTSGGDLENLLGSLETVLWDKSTPEGAERWAGIAGKLTDAGKFSSAGGVKDLGYRMLDALTDPESEDYTRIRGY
jgi:hypothetical protein